MKFKAQSPILLLFFCSIISACTVEDAADPSLYGQKCEGANELNRCPVEQYCHEGKCEPAGPICQEATEFTNEYGYCLPDFRCEGKSCIFNGDCYVSEDCSGNMVCEDFHCICPFSPNQAKCGDNETCCETGGCFNLEENIANCGVCGKACSKGEVCESGECVVKCQTGQEYCGDYCVDTRNSREDCGSCGNTCDSGKVCSSGKCETSCQADLTNCDGTCVNLALNRNNCGSCGNTCEAGKVCNNGSCSLTCQTELTNCDGWCVNLHTDTGNCGSCGHACMGGELCYAGKCSANCADGLIPCDGYCVNLNNDNGNCGACNHPCSSTEVCQQGQCVENCAAGFTMCQGKCVDLMTNNAHCGGCSSLTGENLSTVCSPDGETPSICSHGICKTQCDSDLTECDQKCVDLLSDTTHCGSCHNTCAESEACVNGFCMSSCPAEMEKCDSQCVDLHTSPIHCGTCNQSCPGSHSCINGTCLLICQSPYEICGNKCIDLQMDNMHCGQCNNACGDGKICKNGKCAIYCPPGQTECNEQCFDLLSDNLHCGQCNHECSSGTMCASGECVDKCPTGMSKCLAGDNEYTCVDPLSNTKYCGCTQESTGKDCNVSQQESIGFCSQGSCREICIDPYYDCSFTDQPNCVDLSSNDNHCGNCNHACPKGRPCENGKCACKGSYLDRFHLVNVDIDNESYCGIEIATADDLIFVRDAYKNGNIQWIKDLQPDLNAPIFVITQNIDLGNQSDWSSICSQDSKITLFDGTVIGQNNATISGTLNCQKSHCGLFGGLYNARIEKLNLNFKANVYGSYFGSLAGFAHQSIISDVHSTVDELHIMRYGDSADYNSIGGLIGELAKSSEINHSSFTGKLTIDSGIKANSIGGLFGSIIGETSVKNCKSTADITAYEGFDIGGVAGIIENNITIDSVSYKGNLTLNATFCEIGGFAGKMNSVSISNAKTEGNINILKGGCKTVGGYVGLANNDLTISSSESKMNITIGEGQFDGVGGIAGYVQDKATFDKITYNGEISYQNGTMIGGIVGAAFSSSNSGYLTITNSTSTGKLTCTDSNTSKEIGGFIGHADNSVISDSRSSISIQLDADYIGGFIGTYNNNTKAPITLRDLSFTGSISNIHESYTNFVGGIIGQGTDFILIDALFAGNLKAYSIVGGILGSDKCGITTIANSGTIGIASGEKYIGGIIGNSNCNNTNIYNSYALMKIAANSNGYAIVGEGNLAAKGVYYRNYQQPGCDGELYTLIPKAIPPYDKVYYTEKSDEKLTDALNKNIKCSNNVCKHDSSGLIVNKWFDFIFPLGGSIINLPIMNNII